MFGPSDVKKGITSIPGFIRSYGARGGLRRWSGIVYHRATHEVRGRSIFERDWDVCVVLDACRADELERQRSNFGWIDHVDRFPSLASCTWNWLPRTLETTAEDVLGETLYVSANPFAGEFSGDEPWCELDEVYRYAWDERLGTVRPRPVTDRAINQWRRTDASRMLVHYLQPHVPFLTDDAVPLDRSNFDFEVESITDAWDRVTRGELSRETAVSRYRRSLERVLDDVELLTSNVDADRIVVTADHGEAFGEWGIYGHPPKIDLPCLTEVPWVETTGVDEETHSPETYADETTDVSADEQLEALGYVA